MPESSLYQLLSAIERMPPEACGAFVVTHDGVEVGSVFVEGSRVCWAAYEGLRHRLRDLIREADAMGAAIRQHTIESLLELAQDRGEVLTWVPHKYPTYQPRFTYAPAEVLVAANALIHADALRGGSYELGSIEGLAAASFVTVEGTVIAVGAIGAELTIADLDDLGAWADAAFAVTRGFSRDVVRSALDTGVGELRLAWRTSRTHLHAVVADRGPLLDRHLAVLEARNLPIVVSRRALRSSLTAIHNEMRGTL